jgi:hypothetical protein
MPKNRPAKLDSERLKQLETEQLVEIIIEQAQVIGKDSARKKEEFCQRSSLA